MVTEIKEKAQGFSLEELTALLISLIDKKEENVQSELKALSKKDSKNVSQTELLQVQSKLNQWNNMSNLATGILHGVQDALKATVQNIR